MQKNQQRLNATKKLQKIYLSRSFKTQHQDLQKVQQVGKRDQKQKQKQFLRMNIFMKIMKQRIWKNVSLSFMKMKGCLTRKEIQRKAILGIFRIQKKSKQNLVKEALIKIKNFAQKDKIKIKGMKNLERNLKLLNKKVIETSFHKIYKFSQNILKSNVKLLQQQSLKYRQSNIKHEIMQELRKFQKSNNTNYKTYQKNSQKTLSPIIEQLIKQFSEKRKTSKQKPNIEILLSITHNQNKLLQNLSQNMQQTLTQNKQCKQLQRDLQKQLKTFTAQQQKRQKILMNFDMDLIEKVDKIYHECKDNSTKNVYESFLKIIKLQQNLCGKKVEESYMFYSRKSVLQILTYFVEKFRELQVGNNYMSRAVTPIILEERKQKREQSKSIQKSFILPLLNILQQHQILSKKQQIPPLQTILQSIENSLSLKNVKIQELQKMLIMEKEQNNQRKNKMETKILLLESNIKQITMQENKNKQILLEKIREKQENFKQIQIKFSTKNSQIQQYEKKIQKFKTHLQNAAKKQQQYNSLIKQIKQQSQRFQNAISTHNEKQKKNINSSISNYSITKRYQTEQDEKFQFFVPTPSHKNNSMSTLSHNYNYNRKQKNVQNYEIKAYKSIITKLKQKINKLQVQVQAKADQIQNTQILSNVVSFVFSILIKISKIPEQSENSNIVWNQLLQIYENSENQQLLNCLQNYVVIWVQQNLLGEYDNIIKQKIEIISSLQRKLMKNNTLKKYYRQQNQLTPKKNTHALQHCHQDKTETIKK